MLGNDDPRASVAGEIIPGADFYDYEDKYPDGAAQTVVPADLADDVADEVRRLAVRAFRRCGPRAWPGSTCSTRRAGTRVCWSTRSTRSPGSRRSRCYPMLWAAVRAALPGADRRAGRRWPSNATLGAPAGRTDAIDRPDRERARDHREPRRTRGSSSPGRPASSAPLWSSVCCAACPTSGSTLLVRDGRRSSAAPPGRPRAAPQRLLRPAARPSWGQDGFAEWPSGSTSSPATSAPTGSAWTPTGGPLLAACDVVIHSAAAVAFDSPLDRAVEVNLLGPPRIAETAARARRHPAPRRGVAPATSPATGAARPPRSRSTPNPFFADIDWRTEVAAARPRRARHRRREPLRPSGSPSSRSRARFELGPAGGPLLRPNAPRRSAGLGRTTGWSSWAAPAPRRSDGPTPTRSPRHSARSAAAPDDAQGGHPGHVVRPSIIESSFARAPPGLDPGFRMAEPIILSYARGLLKEFPGVPEGVVDVIPVDLVVAAIIAAAGRTPAVDPSRGRPRIVQVASGDANPLSYQRLVDRVREWFTENPLYDRARPTDRRARPGRSPAGDASRASSTGPPAVLRTRREGRPSTPAPGQGGGVGRHGRGDAARRPNGRSPTSSSTAPTPSARPSTGVDHL